MNKFNHSLEDTTELKKLILENPDLPLLIFAGEDANRDGGYAQVQARVNGIEELILHNNKWIEREEFEEELRNYLWLEDEYKDLSDNEYDKMIEEKVENTKFTEAIVIYVG